MSKIQDSIASYNALREDLVYELHIFIKDKSIDIEERWNVLISSPDLFEISDRTDFDLKRDDDFLYESPMHMSKMETWEVKDIFACLAEEEHDDFDNLDEEEQYTFKEYCCQNFISRMIFDW